MADDLSVYELLRREISGENALSTATRIWQTDRTMSFRRFAETAQYCASVMRDAGLSAVRACSFPADGKTAYGDLVMPKAWDCESAALLITEGDRAETICSYPEEPLSVAHGCGTTRRGGVEGEIVHIDGGARPGDYKGVRCKGKFVLTAEQAGSVAPAACKRGALGVLSYAMPSFPPARPAAWDNADGRLWQRVEPEKGWLAFVLSPRQGEALKRRAQSARADSPLRARATVRSRAYDGDIFAVTGLIPGRQNREIVIIAHLFEPGANDNASGCGCAIELARTILRLSRDRRLSKLNLGIRLLLPMEFNTTLAFYQTHPGIRRRAVAGIVPDMVGEDQAQCGSAMVTQTTPDAAPSFINALMLGTLEAIRASFGATRGREREPYWLCFDRDYWGNDCFVSDPTIGIPTVGLIEWPDRFYHSSTDTPDKVSADALARNGALVGAIALGAATMDQKAAERLCYRMTARAVAELERCVLPVLDSGPDDRSEAISRRVDHVLWRENEALQSVIGLFPPRSPAARRLTGLLVRLSGDLAGAAERVRARHGATRAASTALTKADRRARELVPRRALMGPIRFRNLDAAARRKLRRLEKKGLPTHLLLWIDGSRTAAEVLERCRGEGASVDTRNVLAYLDFLAEHGYLEWAT